MRKKIIIAGLCLYWLVVSIYALPGGKIRRYLLEREMPLPSIRTHSGHVQVQWKTRPLIYSCLLQLNLFQRWKMFTPLRPNAVGLEVRCKGLEGEQWSFTYQDKTRKGLLYHARHRYLESSLLNPRRRTTFVPVASTAIMKRYIEKPVASVEFIKKAHPLPLLKPDETGNPVFTTGADWAMRSASLTNYVDILIGTFQITGQKDEK